MATSKHQYGIITVCILVALRLGIGWHFFKEGADKLQDPNFTSAGFLAGAKGPFAGMFKRMLKDPDGMERLDRDKTLQAWDVYRELAIDHFDFDEQQAAQAKRAYQQRERELNELFDANLDEINTYRIERLARRKHHQESDAYREVASLAEHAAKIEAELRRDRAPWLATIDSMWDGYETELNNLADDEQWERGRLTLKRPGDRFFDVDLVDAVIPWLDVIIGALLLLGLLVRPTALVGALFLCSVVATQFPGSIGAAPTYNQIVEMLALLVLMATGAGRYCGLDFFLNYYLVRPLRNWCCPAKREDNAS